VRVRVLAFGRIRDLLGAEQTLDLPAGARLRDVLPGLSGRFSQLQTLAASTRIARNGRIAPADEPIEDGDELALLPPVGGG
jgi:molybdopterin converting factor small subunit